ncbi:MAG: DUF4007 family protein [Limnochordia bacterium]|jgi:hypothetical protein
MFDMDVESGSSHNRHLVEVTQVHLASSRSGVRYSFSGHESFPFRYGWLAKGVQHALEDRRVFSRDEATIILGVGKNMVRSIKHWCSAIGLLNNSHPGCVEVTELGRLLFAKDGCDPYLEDVGTLWLLHWLLVRDGQNTSTWHLAFTRFGQSSFTRQQLVEYLLDTARTEAPMTRVTEASMKRDVDVFVRTYAPSAVIRSAAAIEESYDCPLVELGLLEEYYPGVFTFCMGNHPALPQAVLAFAIADYWAMSRNEQNVLSIEDILYLQGAPGAAFKLTENALVERLERLPDWTGMRFDETAGRRMLIRSNSGATTVRSPIDILLRYYDSEGEL